MHLNRTGPTLRAAVITIAALIVALVATVAFAQDSITFDPIAWGSNPGLALTALIGAVAWLRQTPLGKRVDGPLLVPAVTAGIGAVGGAYSRSRACSPWNTSPPTLTRGVASSTAWRWRSAP